VARGEQEAVKKFPSAITRHWSLVTGI